MGPDLDINTLFMVTMHVEIMLGLLLYFAWAQNFSKTALAWWGSSHMLRAMSIMLFGMHGEVPSWASIDVANAALFASFALTWSGARVFDRRTAEPVWCMVGVIIWLLACRLPQFAASLELRALVGSFIVTTYTWMAAYEFWRNREEALVSRWPAIFMLFAHGALFLLDRHFVLALLTFLVASLSDVADALILGRLLAKTMDLGVLILTYVMLGWGLNVVVGLAPKSHRRQGVVDGPGHLAVRGHGPGHEPDHRDQARVEQVLLRVRLVEGLPLDLLDRSGRAASGEAIQLDTFTVVADRELPALVLVADVGSGSRATPPEGVGASDGIGQGTLDEPFGDTRPRATPAGGSNSRCSARSSSASAPSGRSCGAPAGRRAHRTRRDRRRDHREADRALADRPRQEAPVRAPPVQCDRPR